MENKLVSSNLKNLVTYTPKISKIILTYTYTLPATCHPSFRRTELSNVRQSPFLMTSSVHATKLLRHSSLENDIIHLQMICDIRLWCQNCNKFSLNNKVITKPLFGKSFHICLYINKFIFFQIRYLIKMEEHRRWDLLATRYCMSKK